MTKKPKQWLRKRSVAARYEVDPRTVERMVRDGRIPAPRYFPNNRNPYWDEEKLDENDRRVIKGR